jgi:hypothetical protein
MNLLFSRYNCWLLAIHFKVSGLTFCFCSTLCSGPWLHLCSEPWPWWAGLCLCMPYICSCQDQVDLKLITQFIGLWNTVLCAFCNDFWNKFLMQAGICLLCFWVSSVTFQILKSLMFTLWPIRFASMSCGVGFCLNKGISNSGREKLYDILVNY